jgi:CO dehydrogenase/acetyl-CoA synthase beta subunit
LIFFFFSVETLRDFWRDRDAFTLRLVVEEEGEEEEVEEEKEVEEDNSRGDEDVFFFIVSEFEERFT